MPIYKIGTTHDERFHLPAVRSVVNGVIRAPATRGNPSCSQRDAYLVWKELSELISTAGCIETALATASECARVLPLDPLITTTRDAESLGFFETQPRKSRGAFGDGAPKVKAW